MWLFAGAGHGYVLAANKQASHPKVWYSRWYGLAGIYIVFILSVELVRWFGYAPYKIPDSAMGPGLKAGDYVLVAKGVYGYSHHSFPFPVPAIRGRVFAAPPEKGDIVVFKATKDADGVLIRRITGLPGERVRLAHGRDVAVPKGHYFVLGDHQNSRPGSLIPEENLIGRVTHILWNGRQRKFRPASVR